MSDWYFCMAIAYTDLISFMFLYQSLDISAVLILCIAYAMIMIGSVFKLLINTSDFFGHLFLFILNKVVLHGKPVP